MFKRVQFLFLLAVIMIAGDVSALSIKGLLDKTNAKKMSRSVNKDTCAEFKPGASILTKGKTLHEIWKENSECLGKVTNIKELGEYNGITGAAVFNEKIKNDYIIIPSLSDDFGSQQSDDIFDEFYKEPEKKKEPKQVVEPKKTSTKKSQPAVADNTSVKSKPKEEIIRTGPGPMHWMHVGVDPAVYDDPEDAWAKLGFSLKEGVLDSLRAKVKRGECTLNFKSYKGESWIEMLGHGRELKVYGQGGRGVLNDFVDREFIEGTMYVVDYSPTQLAEIFKPNDCDNWCWRLIDRPIPITVVVPPQDTTPYISPPPEIEKPPEEFNVPSIPSVPVEPPKKKRNPYGEVFLWTGYYAPLPVFHHGHFYLGGIANGFLPVGKYSGLGLSLKVNTYEGWSPRFYDEEGKPYFGTYAGAMIGLGPIFDLQTRSKNWNSGFNTRTTFACRAYFRHDWYEENHDDIRYWNRQSVRHWYLPQSFGPEITSYIANSDWSKWFQAWVGLNQDLVFISGNENYGYREAHLNGERRSLYDDPLRNKTVIDWGLGWFFLPLSSSKNMTLGVKANGNHMWEDDRWEVGGGPSLRVGQVQFGFEGKVTLGSKYNNQNGPSLKFSVDIDPTPRNKPPKIEVIEPSGDVNFTLPTDAISEEELPLDNSGDSDFEDLFSDDSTLSPTSSTSTTDFSDIPCIPLSR